MSKRLVLLVGGAGGLGLGAYVALQQQEVKKCDKEVAEIATLVSREKKAASATSGLITEQEARAKELAVAEATARTSLQQLEDKLEAARAEVAALEAKREGVLQGLDKTAAETKSVLSRLVSLRTSMAKAQEAATMGEKSLAEAKRRAAEAQKLMNPLNHPRLKGVLGTGSK